MTNLLKLRIGVLFPQDSPLVTGTVTGYDTDTFTVTVSVSAGALSNVDPGMILSEGGWQWARIKSVNAGASTVLLSENPLDLQNGDTVYIYRVRHPTTRYQKISDDGTVYMDWDETYPSAQPWQTLPPAVLAKLSVNASGSPTTYWLPESGDVIIIDARDSYYVATDSGSGLTYTWDIDGGNYVAPGDDHANGYAVIRYASAGFYYPSVTVTDSYGEETTRYFPLWVGQAQLENVAEFSMRYDINNGWEASLRVRISLDDVLPYGPVAIVKLPDGDDDPETLFLGYPVLNSYSYDYETEELALTLRTALSALGSLHSYPFRLESEAGGSEWHQIPSLTLTRACWVLLRHRTNICELTDVELDPTERTIDIQRFPAGSVDAQLKELSKSAFWSYREDPARGFTIAEHPLYDSTFPTRADVLSVTTADLVADVDVELPEARVSEARLTGLYKDGGEWQPAIAKAPTHPVQAGKPVEMRGLAPTDAAEILTWAKRHVGLENLAYRLSVELFKTVDPRSYAALDVPDQQDLASGASMRVCVESINITFNVDGLSATCQIDGRTYGEDITGQAVDPPPEPEFPDPPDYDTTPPVDPVEETEPEPAWPTNVYVATRNNGVYRPQESYPFTGPDGTMTRWETINTGLPSNNIYQFAVDPADPEERQFALLSSPRDVYVRTETAGSWSALLTTSQAETLVGGTGDIAWFSVDGSTGDYYVLFVGDMTVDKIYCLVSSDQGSNWTAYAITPNNNSRAGGNILGYGGTVYAALNYDTIAKGKVAISLSSGATWELSDKLFGSAAAPMVHIDTNDLSRVYVGGMADYSSLDPDDDAVLLITAFPSGIAALGLPEGWGYSFSQNNYPCHVIKPTATQRQIVLDENENKLALTEDGWASWSYQSIGDGDGKTDVVIAQIYLPSEWASEWLVLAKSSSGSGSVEAKSHVLYVSDDNADTMTGRAGPDPLTPDADSIPYNCGGLAHGGFQPVAWS